MEFEGQIQSHTIISVIYVSKMWDGILRVTFNVIMISCHCGTLQIIHPSITTEKEGHIGRFSGNGHTNQKKIHHFKTFTFFLNAWYYEKVDNIRSQGLC